MNFEKITKRKQKFTTSYNQVKQTDESYEVSDFEETTKEFLLERLRKFKEKKQSEKE